MKRLITEKARREAFRPTASIKNTALNDPNKAPRARRLPEGRNIYKNVGKLEHTQEIQSL